jgi:hypothetical protein
MVSEYGTFLLHVSGPETSTFLDFKLRYKITL